MPKKPKATRRTSDDPAVYLALKMEEWLQEGEELEEALLPHFPEAAAIGVELPAEMSKDQSGYLETAEILLSYFHRRGRYQDFNEWLRKSRPRATREATLPEVLEQGI
jgi:hypothetical protein